MPKRKVCGSCGRRRLVSFFYAHPNTADRLQGKCKDCHRSYAKKHRQDNIERVREYDRRRGNRSTPEYQRSWRRRFPGKARAQRMVAYHVRAGNIAKKPCEVCGAEPTHAHHDDYAKPLDVRWLCAEHHRAWHDEHGEAPNG